MVTNVLVATGFVVTVNVAKVVFSATVTLAGTVAAVMLLLLSVTTAPPDGAAALRVTFPLVEVPPVTDGGVKATEPTPGGNTVKVALCVVLL
jgi:hypothetical protein